MAAAKLPDPEQAGIDDATLIDLAVCWQRLEALACERKIAAATEFYERRADSHARVPLTWLSTAHERAEAEVAAALAIGKRAAGRMIGLGLSLKIRLRATREAMSRGELTCQQVHEIDGETRNVTAEAIAAVERQILERILRPGSRPPTGRRLRTLIHQIICRHDPDGVRARREEAEADRYVEISPLEHGMAGLFGMLRAADGRVLDQRLTEIADTVCIDDPRSKSARRADALIALCNGEESLACLCGHVGCPNATGNPPRRRRAPLVHVIVTDRALQSESPRATPADELAYLDGHGVIDAALAREIAATGTVRDLTFTLSEGAEQRYEPTQAVAHLVRALYGHCQWPDCSVPAWRCDLDHIVPFNHEDPARGGRTSLTNLIPLCRAHHRIKTLGEWTIRRAADFGLIFTAPTGHTYQTEPTGPVQFLTGQHPVRCHRPALPPKASTRDTSRAGRIRRERLRNRQRSDDAAGEQPF